MHPKTKQIDASVQALHFCEDGSDTPAAVSSVLAKPPYNGSDTRAVIPLALGIGYFLYPPPYPSSLLLKSKEVSPPLLVPYPPPLPSPPSPEI
jgi:hypothetical protein